MTDEIDVLAQKYAREYGPTGDTYYSSAAQFAQYLEKQNIISPVEIWHKYTLPNNMGAIDFFNLLRRLDFLLHYEMFGMQVQETETIANARANAPKQLSDLVNQTQKLNPELQGVKVKTRSQIDFLDGVNFGFPPEDIDCFLQQSEQDLETREHNFNILSKQDEILKKKLGKAPGWIMAQKRMTKLVDAVTQNVPIIKR